MGRTAGVHLEALRVLEADPALAGAWYDPSSDGRLTLAFVGPVTLTASAEALARSGEAFRPDVRDVERTLAQLTALLAELDTDLAADEGRAQDPWRSRVDVRRNAVVLTVDTSAPAGVEVRLRETFGRPGVQVVRDAASCGVLHGSELGTGQPGSTG